MDWVQAAVEIPLTVLITVAITWIFGRHYYLKTRAGETTMTALEEAVRRGMRTLTGAAAEEADKQFSSRFAREWAVRLIDAYEKRDIYEVELRVAYRTFREVGKLLEGAFAAADKSFFAGEVPQPLSPRYIELKEQALRKELVEVKRRLHRELQDEL